MILKILENCHSRTEPATVVTQTKITRKLRKTRKQKQESREKLINKNRVGNGKHRVMKPKKTVGRPKLTFDVKKISGQREDYKQMKICKGFTTDGLIDFLQTSKEGKARIPGNEKPPSPKEVILTLDETKTCQTRVEKLRVGLRLKATIKGKTKITSTSKKVREDVTERYDLRNIYGYPKEKGEKKGVFIRNFDNFF